MIVTVLELCKGKDARRSPSLLESRSSFPPIQIEFSANPNLRRRFYGA
jgi:hypothetical protein